MDSLNLYIVKEKEVLLYIQMVFCATVLITDILYRLEFSVVVKDVQMCVYNIDTVYAYHLLFFFLLRPLYDQAVDCICLFSFMCNLTLFDC